MCVYACRRIYVTLDPYTPLFLAVFLIQDITNRNASPVLNNARKLLLKTIDGRASESDVLPMTRAEKQKTAAASVLAGGGLLWVYCEALWAWQPLWQHGKMKGKKNKSNQISTIRSEYPFFVYSVSFVSTVLSGGKWKQLSWCPSGICSS